MDSYESTSQEGGIKKSPFQDLSREDLIQKCKGLLAIAQKAKKLQAETEDQAESYKVKLEKCESEQKESLINLQTLQELVDSLTEQKLNYITEVDSAKGKIKVLSDKCKKYEEDLKKINAEFKIKENHITDTTKKLSDLDTEIISLNRQYKRLVDENEQLINQLSELEAKTAEFNNIGLHQRQQLELLENKVHTDDVNRIQIETLNKRIAELESETELFWSNKIKEYESKLTDITQQYEEEKSKKEKANIKLRSYKDKILKCAACINQLKNSRFILTKTINEYSENIPKWQNDLIKASKIIDDQMVELNKENSDLKIRLQTLEEQLINISNSSSNAEIIKLNEDNSDLHKKLIELEQSYKLATEYIEEHNSTQFTELSNKCQYLQSQLKDFEIKNFRASEGNTKLLAELEIMRCEYHKLHETQLPELNEENKKLKTKLNELKHKCESLKHKNEELLKSNQLSNETNETIANLHLQIKALQSEKDNVVKEKFKARDHVVELESQNRILLGQVDKFKLELQTTKEQLDTLLQEKNALERNIKAEKENEVKNEKPKLMILQEQFDLFKKEYDLLENLNGMLKEEVDTLKLSLEQPRLEDNENVSDVNVSLQADIVKLETKLAAYKQENASLLSEIKECRAKAKEYDNLAAENEELKSKFTSYKTENTELLNEMKEINQVLKERGEAISKLQKTITEMERLVETLEKDRDNVNTVNEDLLKKVAVLESDLANAEQKTNKNCEVAEKTLIEKANALKVLKDKDTIITSLKEEIEKFKQHQTSVAELPNEDMSTSTISKAEDHSRMKDLDETFEEKYTKLRIFALKLKKKLNETVAQLQNAEQDKAKLEKILNENEKVPHSTCDEVDSSKKTEITNLEIKVKDLTASVHASEHITKELEKNKAELENKNQQLVAEIEAHKVTKENLEKARRDAKKKNVLSLEMEDYERSMKELTSKMEEKKKKMVQMESTIDTQEGTITAMKTQIKLLEEQIRAEEKQNRLTREELQHAIEDGKEKDNVIHTKNGAISKLEKDHEDEKRKNEEADLEMTALLSEKEKNLITLGEEKIELNNKVKKLEFKCAELNETLRITNIELADLKTEYTSYKVRAQAVLRQNQTVDHSQEEQLKEETAALRAQIDTLTAKLTTTQEQLSEANSEMETTRRRAAEAAGEAARAQQRTTRLHADLTRLDHQLDSERAQHKLQVSTLTQCYKTQISELEARLQKEIDVLKKQLAAEQESAKSSAGVLMLDEANHNQYMLPVIPKDDSDGEMDINVSMIPREEGEGSESAPSPPPSKPYLTSAGSGRSPVPLERLLEEGVPDDEALDAASLALTPDQEISDLKRRLQAQQQRVKHVTLLLAESERECARMSQLSELLKAELRRAHGSTHAAHNAEYMKNVTLKFLTLPPGDERGRLVPVLQKILTLTPDETNKVNAVARGLDPNPSKGWGSYLPWPGGK